MFVKLGDYPHDSSITPTYNRFDFPTKRNSLFNERECFLSIVNEIKKIYENESWRLIFANWQSKLYFLNLR